MLITYHEPLIPRIESPADLLGALACIALVCATFGPLAYCYWGA